MRQLSKSRIISYRQCPKRLWLEIHRKELRDDSASELSFAIGNEVGEIAMDIYNTTGTGVEVKLSELGYDESFRVSGELLEAGDRPIFEAGVTIPGGLAFADVMLPESHGNQLTRWKMVEVKSSTKLKEYQRDDAAVQNFLFESAGVELSSVSVAHIDSSFTYNGSGNYQGLLQEHDLTDEVRQRKAEVESWFHEAQQVAASTEEPSVACGAQCDDPFPCPFLGYCRPQDPNIQHPVSNLPRIGKKKVYDFESRGIFDMVDTPDSELNATQQKVKDYTLSNSVYFDQQSTIKELAQYGFPAYFLDFETSMTAIPVWKGTRPFQQLPFQFSLHVLDESGSLEHCGFLDISGDDPRLGFSEALIKHCGNSGPIYVYNAGFERRIIREQASVFPHLENDLLAIADRLVDLLPMARKHYYHPSQKGSWSLKAVLPAICPDLDYSALNGVQDGGMAMVAFQEAIQQDCPQHRKDEIYRELEEYCKLDTYAMVRIWEVFMGQ